MKQTIVACLVLLAAVCYAAEKEVDNKQDVVSLLKRLLEKKSETKVEEKAEVRSDKISEIQERMMKSLQESKRLTHNQLSEVKERMMKSLQESKKEKKLTHKFSQFDGNCDIADVYLNSEYGFDGGIIVYPKISKTAQKDGPCTFHITAQPHQELLFDVMVTSNDADHCNHLEIHDGSDASGEAHEIVCDGSSHNFLAGNEAFISFTEDQTDVQSFVILYGVFDLPSDDSDLHSSEKEDENKHHQKHSKHHHHRHHHSKH